MRISSVWFRLLLVAAAASAVGFAIHVADQSVVPP